MDYKIWIDLSAMTPGDWIGLVAVVLTILCSILILVKLALTWPGADDEPEPMEMDDPGLYLVDRTDGEKLAIARENLADETDLVNQLSAEIVRLKRGA